MFDEFAPPIPVARLLGRSGFGNAVGSLEAAASDDIQEITLLGIIASGSLNASNGIARATATKQSGNWDRWGTFLKHSGITDEFLGGIPQEQRTILVSSFSASVQRNQFVKTSK